VVLKSNVKKGGRPKVVKSVTVPGKCYAISDGDRQDDPIFKQPNCDMKK
jgi:hypothetical protein